MSGDVLGRLEAVITQPSELLVGAVLALRSAREQTAMRVGRCGHRAPFPPHMPPAVCELPAEHPGWHRDGRVEWQPPGPPMCAVHQVPDMLGDPVAVPMLTCAACAVWMAARR